MKIKLNNLPTPEKLICPWCMSISTLKSTKPCVYVCKCSTDGVTTGEFDVDFWFGSMSDSIFDFVRALDFDYPENVAVIFHEKKNAGRRLLYLIKEDDNYYLSTEYEKNTYRR